MAKLEQRAGHRQDCEDTLWYSTTTTFHIKKTFLSDDFDNVSNSIQACALELCHMIIMKKATGL